MPFQRADIVSVEKPPVERLLSLGQVGEKPAKSGTHMTVMQLYCRHDHNFHYY